VRKRGRDLKRKTNKGNYTFKKGLVKKLRSSTSKKRRLKEAIVLKADKVNVKER